ncbi:hypothetical protein R1sor_002534 [Riccia sorocarpa]|uniref:CCHC-type domain-containing protein n=1 Tax=Riccia sorocarpa TaxID=122646 RepID=A0ABD3GZ36_9MARC
MVDLNQDLKDVVKMVFPEMPDRIMRLAVRYTKLPDACFISRERGHFARTCPTAQNQAGESEARQAFIRTTRREPAQTQGGRSTGPYRAQQRTPEARRDGGGEPDADGFTGVRGRSMRRFQEPMRQVNMKVDNRYSVLQTEEEEDPSEENSTTQGTPKKQRSIGTNSAHTGHSQSSSQAGRTTNEETSRSIIQNQQVNQV